ncbi:DUF998 domain-containing protein [Geotalea sp. SG265]|uniref:DUF998 domain-containing protein n=1 Tax=Geotalea sp. SG265 TaxID=2922867 RepID=UPI001FAF25B2|nr:DUF998 domain-containing protein [Geotalea sp. SG265]
MRDFLAGAVTIGGVIVFAVTIGWLQLVQPQYDPIHQYMSELVMGRSGAVLLIGFCGLGISIYSAQVGLAASAAPKGFRALLSCAAISMVGAGIFTMDQAVELHVSLVALAFALLVISMYLLPVCVGQFSSKSARMASWLSSGCATVSIALSGTVPDGVSQRAAAVCVGAWLLWIGISKIRKRN